MVLICHLVKSLFVLSLYDTLWHKHEVTSIICTTGHTHTLIHRLMALSCSRDKNEIVTEKKLGFSRSEETTECKSGRLVSVWHDKCKFKVGLEWPRNAYQCLVPWNQTQLHPVQSCMQSCFHIEKRWRLKCSISSTSSSETCTAQWLASWQWLRSARFYSCACHGDRHHSHNSRIKQIYFS